MSADNQKQKLDDLSSLVRMDSPEDVWAEANTTLGLFMHQDQLTRTQRVYEHTLALYHFDALPGDCSATLSDSSGASGGPSDGACSFGGAPPPGPAYSESTPFVEAKKMAPKMDKRQVLVVNLSGRGDKDVEEAARILGKDLGKGESE